MKRLGMLVITKVRHLVAEIRHRGYTGSFSHLRVSFQPGAAASLPSRMSSRRSQPRSVYKCWIQ